MKRLPTWRYLLEMIRYKPWLYLLHATLWSTANIVTILAGLLARTFFDTLTGKAHLPGALRDLLYYWSCSPCAG
ncbi:hypothetical protein KDW_32510 [Dictyobacter vulcani]|uniref:ABC transmembrane type-1 domain-containing protein n=1 Tax=Dictyobacter vulcani TaxID=2607529 RepID=A0A5J4KSL0_9CHLR|nr:hypothetical protein [Dictyobacter vulcani]GER89089.1 hypothetical protein KDW_32510 [Dictyobacter vulcani]